MASTTRFHETVALRWLAGLFSGLLLSAAALAGSPQIDPDKGAKLIEQDVLVIDVRTQAEIDDSGIIEGAEHIEHRDIEGLKAAIGADTQRPVVLYCGSGRRVAMAIDALQAEGYTGLVNAGGYDDLYAAIRSRADATDQPE